MVLCFPKSQKIHLKQYQEIHTTNNAKSSLSIISAKHQVTLVRSGRAEPAVGVGYQFPLVSMENTVEKRVDCWIA